MTFNVTLGLTYCAGGTRFCVDFQACNSKTPLDGFSMAQVHEILVSLHRATVFSTLEP